MNTPIEHIFSDVETFFESPATAEEKAWGMIHDFYHLVLTYMEEQQISKADLSKRLGKSRSAISQRQFANYSSLMRKSKSSAPDTAKRPTRHS